MYLVGGSRINIKGDTEILKCLFVDGMITVDHFLWCDTFISCLEGYGNTVFVRSADRYNVNTLKSQISCINVGRDVDSGKVADMQRPVGVWQSRGNKVSLVILHLQKWSFFKNHKDNVYSAGCND